MTRHIEGFVLTRQWRDASDGLELTFWLASDDGPVCVRRTGERDVMFIPREAEAQADQRRQLQLTSMFDEPVDALYFHTRRKLMDERERLRRDGTIPYESDVRPANRYLMERFITGSCRVSGRAQRRRGFIEMHNPIMKCCDYQPTLRVVSFDIETDGMDGPVISIAATSDGLERVLMVGTGDDTDTIRFLPDERAVITAFIQLIERIDPDALIGWNVIEFDLTHLQQRCEALSLRFTLGRSRRRAVVLPPQSASQLPLARVPGRVVLDGIGLLRTATYSFESFALDNVAHELLGRRKAIDHDADKVEEIRRMHREDPHALAAYNLEDCRLVRDIFTSTDLLSFATERQRMTGLPMDRVGGAVAAFDHLYLPRLHRAGHVATDVGMLGESSSAPGGYVLASQPGLYDNVLVLDFKSLYPSIIRTFKIDPMGLAFPGDEPIAGFDGASFSREEHILPRMIESLWQDRDRAKLAKNEPLSRTIKILMNSFYGVLGTPGCRFYSPRLASSITRRGHEIITRSRDWIRDRQRSVIYGDTDSLFVLLGPEHDRDACLDIGAVLARELNSWWRERIEEEHGVDSCLEVEFETHYHRFFMPTLRGSDQGSAKRYAGLVMSSSGKSELVVKGLEAVRTDWTPLARNFQRELLERVLSGQPYEELLHTLRRQLLDGELDEQLVYRKRLRRELSSYVKNVPPHVKAARQLDRAVRVVSYVMTVRGPEPIEKRSSPLDYHHYLERQVAPAADGILACVGSSFSEIAGDQLNLF
jgi:DNA polymerase-2